MLFIITLNSVNAQIFYDKYVNLKLGQGISFGGLGTAIEYRYKRVGFIGSIGYKQEQYIYEHVVPSSWNVGADFRYYASKNYANWQFYAGVHGGWLSNYYHPNIANQSYRSTVYGFAITSGIEIREEILNIEIGLSIDPGRLIFYPSKHPYYSDNWSVLPSVAIGINLYALRAELKYKHTLKNNPTHPIKQEEYIKQTIQNLSDDSIHANLISQQASVLLESCTSYFKTAYEKAFYQHDTLYLFKPVGNKKNIVVKFYLPSVNKEQFICTVLSDSIANPSVFYLSEDISLSSADELPYLLDETEQAHKAIKGVVCLYTRPPYCYVNLERVFFKVQQTTLYFDRIIFCEMSY